MNRIYRQVWNEARQCWMAAPETAKGRGKSKSALRKGGLALATAAAFGVQAAPPANTLPTGGQVVAGQAAISTAGSTMTIQQASDKAILNWQSFSIGSGAAVNFVQPSASSVALNRVLGNNPSEIYGRLSANGQVFLINPSGVLFAPGSQVDVGGLVASTMNIRNEDFLGGLYRFTRDGTSAAVVNQGAINARYAALLGPRVLNEGVIAAPMGSIALAAGEAVTLGITGQSRLSVQVDKATIDTLVENRHLVKADGGAVLMSAQSANALLGSVVNSGTVEANGISTDGGVVRLLASSNIEHSGVIRVDAGANGKGGSAILLADLSNPASRTDVSGAISARGGTQSGDGGFIETSGHKLSIADSARIDAGAANGASGLWLLDPQDFTIALTGGDTTGAALGTALATSDVTIQTGAGGAGNGDLFVNASVTWASTKKLTMQAARNIYVNSEINVNGTGTLLLNYDNANGGGDYFVRAPINLAAGSTFQTQRETDAAVTYTVIRTNADLAAVGAGLAGNYVLGTNVTATTNPWVPIGDSTTPFTGVFDGLGHTVTGVTRPNTDNATTGIGLFGQSDGTIRNVGVTNVNVAGSVNVGGLVGINGGNIKNAYSTGTVTGSDKDSAAAQVGSIGGLVGRNNGNIDGSYSSATVSATGASGGDQGAGGAMNFTQGGIGGLAGSSQSPITNSYATGAVTGISDVGGLVGYSMGAISTSYSTGAVTGTNNVGGLLGFGFAPAAPILTDTFWNTTTSTQAASWTDGGMNVSTGLATAAMKQQANFTSFNFTDTWVIRENNSTPLLRGMLPPLFVMPTAQTKVYDGAVFGGANAVTYSTPTNGKTAGAADFTGGTWATGINAGSYTIPVSGITLASDTDQHGFLSVTALNGALTITPKPVTLTAPNVTKVYNGTTAYTTAPGDLAALSAQLGVVGDTVTAATLTYDTAAAATGTKTVTPSAFTISSGNGNYTITPADSTASTISPKPVTLTPQAATKVFDGTANYTATAADLLVLTGQLGVAGDTVTGITLTYNSPAAGTGKTLTPSAAAVSSAAGNYNFTYADNMASIITAATTTTSSTTTTQVNQVTTPVIQQGSTSPNNVPPGTRNFIPNPQARVSTGVSVTTAISFAGQGTPGQGATQALPLTAIRILQSLTQAWGDPEVAKAFAAMFGSSLVDALPDTVSGNKFNLTIQPQTSQ